MVTIEQTGTLCECRHGIGVHNTKSGPGCIFCGCTQFQRPTVKVSDVPVALSKFASAALDALQQGPGLPGVKSDGMAAFVKEGKGRMFAAEDRLVSRGQKCQTVHVVMSGSVLVQKDGGSEGRELGPGMVAGDLRAFTGDPRWATITALNSASTLEVDTTNLGSTFAKYPELLNGLVRSVMPFSEHPEEIMKSPLWAARRGAAAQPTSEDEGLDAEKRLAIAARWELMKRQQRAAEEAALRAQRVAREAISSQTRR